MNRRGLRTERRPRDRAVTFEAQQVHPRTLQGVGIVGPVRLMATHAVARQPRAVLEHEGAAFLRVTVETRSLTVALDSEGSPIGGPVRIVAGNARHDSGPVEPMTEGAIESCPEIGVAAEAQGLGRLPKKGSAVLRSIVNCVTREAVDASVVVHLAPDEFGLRAAPVAGPARIVARPIDQRGAIDRLNADDPLGRCSSCGTRSHVSNAGIDRDRTVW